MVQLAVQLASLVQSRTSPWRGRSPLPSFSPKLYHCRSLFLHPQFAPCNSTTAMSYGARSFHSNDGGRPHKRVKRESATDPAYKRGSGARERRKERRQNGSDDEEVDAGDNFFEPVKPQEEGEKGRAAAAKASRAVVTPHSKPQRKEVRQPVARQTPEARPRASKPSQPSRHEGDDGEESNGGFFEPASKRQTKLRNGQVQPAATKHSRELPIEDREEDEFTGFDDDESPTQPDDQPQVKEERQALDLDPYHTLTGKKRKPPREYPEKPIVPTDEAAVKVQVPSKPPKKPYQKPPPKPLPFKRELAEAERRKAEAEERQRIWEERQKEREMRMKEREKYNRQMAKVKAGHANGQRRLGRESVLLLDRVKRLVSQQ